MCLEIKIIRGGANELLLAARSRSVSTINSTHNTRFKTVLDCTKHAQMNYALAECHLWIASVFGNQPFELVSTK